MEEPAQSTLARTQSYIRHGLQDSVNYFRSTQQHNLYTIRRQPLQEISGAFGDLGTLLPIMIVLAESSPSHPPTIDIGSTLVFTGLANIATGLFFGIPLPVQPMKAIAAVALSRNFNQEKIASAGLFVAAIVGFFSITRLLEWFNRKIPIPVIKGIQVGVGLSLITYAGNLLASSDYKSPGDPDSHAAIAIFAFIGLLVTIVYSHIPYALVMLFFGILVALPSLIQKPTALNIWHPHAFVPSTYAFSTGIDAGLGQIPLTILNSIIAVSALSADLLPTVPTPSITSIGLSVTAMNLVSCWFGSMPVCHGSGGLAAQYRFGARSGASIIFLGLIKFLLGLFAGNFANHLFNAFPNAILGIMIIAAGLEIASVGETLNSPQARDLREKFLMNDNQVDVETSAGDRPLIWLTDDERRRRWTTMLVTIGGIVAFKNDAIGFIAGMLCHWIYELRDHRERVRAEREGTIRLPDQERQALHAAS